MGKPSKLAGIRAVAFDAFGTLVHIPGYRKPYRQLIDYLKRQGLPIRRIDSDRLMTTPIDLSAVGAYFGCNIPAEILVQAERDLQYDLDSTILFEDTLRTISRLQHEGMQVAICSNLALPYGAPVQALLPNLDAYVWSYVAGAIKPDAPIYANLCQSLNYSPCEVLMIGDTLEADYLGPRRFGMQSMHLARNEETQAPHFLRSLDEIFQ